jgi:hypothetical protein
MEKSNIKTKTLSSKVIDQYYNLYKITNLFEAGNT